MIKYYDDETRTNSEYMSIHYPNMGYLLSNIDKNKPHNPTVTGTLRAICDKDSIEDLLELRNKLQNVEPLTFANTESLESDDIVTYEQGELTEYERELYN